MNHSISFSASPDRTHETQTGMQGLIAGMLVLSQLHLSFLQQVMIFLFMCIIYIVLQENNKWQVGVRLLPLA